MYAMSPEDRLWLVKHQKRELREEMALERTANAASTKRGAERSGARGASDGGTNPLWASAQRLVRGLAQRHAVSPHGVTR